MTAIPVAEGPIVLAATADAVWVEAHRANHLSRIDPARNMEVARLTDVSTHCDVAVGGGAVWATNAHTSVVTKVDPGRGSVLGTIEVTEACGVAADGSSLWIVSPALGEMLRFDPETLKQKASIQLGKMSFLVATGAEGVWAAGETYGGTVWRVDPASNSVVAELAVPQPFVTGLELGFGSAWVASRELATIYRIDPATNTVGKTLKMPSYIGGIGVGSDSIWISGWGDGMVHRLDPATNEIVASVNTGYGNLGPPLEAIGSLWVAALDRNEVLRLDLAAFDD